MTGKSSEMPLETAVVTMRLLYVVLATRVETGAAVHTAAEPSVDEAKRTRLTKFHSRFFRGIWKQWKWKTEMVKMRIVCCLNTYPSKRPPVKQDH